MDQALELIENQIYHIRGRKVMLDSDLAALYAVETKRLNEQVRRNIKRFPVDFMFQFTKEEFLIFQNGISRDKPDLKSQFATSSISHGGKRKLPYAFTEQGIAMLSSVLKSETAIAVNIQIMRIFIKNRQKVSGNRELWEKIEQIEKKYDKQFQAVFRAIYKLISKPPAPKSKIGFDTNK